MIILEENFKWHSEAFASELFICTLKHLFVTPQDKKWTAKKLKVYLKC